MPQRFAVCPRCEGRGTHVNPAVDGNGLSAEDIDELGGDDFMEDYLGGVYDVKCEECHGDRVVPRCHQDGCDRPVEAGDYWHWGDMKAHKYSGCYEHLTPDEREAVDDENDYQATVAAERRMGA